ncbi:MAG: MASE3 domain-containing protein [Sedimentibacter sp.]
MYLNKTRALNILFVGTLLVLLYISSLYNYLLFHSLVEIFSICIAFSIFLITWNSKEFIKNNLLLIIGISYLFIGMLDLLHTLSYKGMNIFTDYDYYANQLWIATRFLESITMLSSFAFLKHKKILNAYILFTIYLIVSSVIVASIFYWKIFPICFIDGVGLTQFKIVSEYIISFILLFALILSWYYRNYFDNLIYKYIASSIIFTILSELAFTFYISNYGFSNMIGHYLKLFSFYFIYKAIIEKAIKEPFKSIFNELHNQVNKDALTGLFNHGYLYEKLIEEIKISSQTNKPFSIIMLDVDHFKRINDVYGHVKGDDTLLRISNVIKKTTRTTDIAGRYGGEEFMVILPNTNIKNCYIVAEKIRNEVKRNDFCDDGTIITISAGIAEFNHLLKDGELSSITALTQNFVNIADSNLYKAKSGGRDMTFGLETLTTLTELGT